VTRPGGAADGAGPVGAVADEEAVGDGDRPRPADVRELPDSVTSALIFNIARYDLKITSPNTDKTRLIQGRVRLSRQETV
jgi:hypothetical protein